MIKRKFECKYCGSIITMVYDKDKYITPPKQPIYCDENQGGCGRKSQFYELKPNWKPVRYDVDIIAFSKEKNDG